MKQRIIAVAVAVLMILTMIPVTGNSTHAATHVCEFKEVTRVDKTCTSSGYVKKQCSCGITRTEILDAGHEYGNYIEVRKATCKVTAKYESTCALCGVKQTLVDTKYGEHEVVDVAEKAATCKEAGRKAGKKCEVCGKFTEGGETIAKGDHKEVTLPAVAATCTKTGKTEGKKCEVCGTTTVKQTTIAKLDHIAVSFDKTPATCEEAGQKAGTKCSVCGTIISGGETIKALGHNKVAFAGVAATCYKKGLTAGHKCDRCNRYYSDVKSIDKLEHNIVVDKAVKVTCTEDGKTEGKHCSLCKEVFVAQEVIKAPGHVEKFDEGYAATCDKDGLTDGSHCSVCNKVIVKQQVIKAYGHTEVIEKPVALTCTTDGMTRGKHCSTCKEVLVEQYIIYSFGHNGREKVVKKATKSSQGLVKKTCTVCNEALGERTVPKIGTVKLSETFYVYDLKSKTPEVIIKDAKGNPIDEDNYTLTVPKERMFTGKYTYTVKFKNEYSGTVTMAMKIAPKVPEIKTPAALKKGLTAKWGKVYGKATGYQVMVATNSKFTKGKKTVYVNNLNSASKKITGLKGKTKYWVKVRAYKTAGSEKIYSSWSKSKTVKTK